VTPHEVDVSWQALRQIVHDWAGSAAELDEVTPLAGGCINTTLCLHTKDGQKAVLKITPHRVDHAYADESHQLGVLRDVGIPVPDIYACKTGSLEQPFSYLLMQFVEGIDLGTAKSACTPAEYDEIQSHLAELVLLLHDRRSPHYMRLSAAEPKRFDHWHECYHDIFDGIWKEVEKSDALPTKSRKLISRIHARLDRLLMHDDGPRLVHWDIWSTNVLACRAASGHWQIAAILDPNCKYAHAEAELAYLELFHTATPAFLRAYQRQRKLTPEYHRVRKPIYQLYTLINHLQLFGNEYVRPVEAALKKAAVLV
jgi:fructosamine-3-kinase